MLALACSKPVQETNDDEAAARELLKLIEQGDKNDGGLAERAQYGDDDYDSPAVDNDRAFAMARDMLDNNEAKAQFFGRIFKFVKSPAGRKIIGSALQHGLNYYRSG